MTPPRGPAARRLFVHLGLWAIVLTAPPAGWGQQAELTEPPSTATAPAPDRNEKAAAEPQLSETRFFESLTVSATLTPSSVKEAPGTVTVIDADTIQRRMIENVADLVRFEPGVYIESNVTRIGLNGFNIRGIGGNRVMTQVDGVETSEQFDFGPFNVHQFALDLDTLKSAEIMRSAGSALYGSDALGGVVSLLTKDPADYLAPNRHVHVGLKTLYDGRSGDRSGNAVVAGGGRRVQASLFLSFGRGHEIRNKGMVDSDNATRTRLNPQDRHGLQTLGKLVWSRATGNLVRAAVETADNDTNTNAFSLRTAAVPDIRSFDTMRRRRASIDQSLDRRLGLDFASWNAYFQNADTSQTVNEQQRTTVAVLRHGTLDYAQRTWGGAVQGRKLVGTTRRAVLLTFGGSHKHHTFDMLRDRLDTTLATGAIVAATNLILPSKYFPRSDVGETGAYLQSEMRLGRLTFVPGVRVDRFTLDADGNDAVFLATLSPTPDDFAAARASARLGIGLSVSRAVSLHALYAGGFRAPPYSAINSGFTNLTAGYTTLPNTHLKPEASNNLEVGVRSSMRLGSFGVTGFWNAYDNFILQAQSGVNSTTGLLEFQYQNLSDARIRGVELQGEALLPAGLRLRASYAVIRGDDVSGATPVSLQTIAPDQGVVGLMYASAGRRFGGDVSLRASRAQPQARAGVGLFAPGAYTVADTTAWVSLGRSVMLRGGVLNVTDRRYFEWPNVRGRQATDVTIDRYSSPARSGLLALSYGW